MFLPYKSFLIKAIHVTKDPRSSPKADHNMSKGERLWSHRATWSWGYWMYIKGPYRWLAVKQFYSSSAVTHSNNTSLVSHSDRLFQPLFNPSFNIPCYRALSSLKLISLFMVKKEGLASSRRRLSLLCKRNCDRLGQGGLRQLVKRYRSRYSRESWPSLHWWYQLDRLIKLRQGWTQLR